MIGVVASGLRGVAATALRDAGLPSRHADIVGDALVDAEAWGKASHGLLRLPVYVERVRRGGIRPSEPQVVTDNGAVTVIDAMGAAGQVAGLFAADVAIARASDVGVAITAVRNSNHLGHLGYVARRGARHGLVCGCMSNASPRLGLGGAAGPIFGNNPWSVALPREAGPIVVDMANSEVAAGKIREAQAAGVSIPGGWALDATGSPTSDPDAALAGSLLPMAGYKGFVIALLVSVLTAGLAGGDTEGSVRSVDDLASPQAMSQVVWALEPSFFAGRDALARVVEVLSERLGSYGRARLPGTVQERLRLVSGKEVVAFDEGAWRRVERDLSALLGSRRTSAALEVVPLEV